MTADRNVSAVGNVPLPPDLRELVKTSVEAEIARRGDGELLDLWKAHIQPLSVEEMRQAMRDIIGQPQDAQGNMLFQGRPIPRGVFHEMKAVWQRELDKKKVAKINGEPIWDLGQRKPVPRELQSSWWYNAHAADWL